MTEPDEQYAVCRRVSLLRWFALYGLLMAGGIALMTFMLAQRHLPPGAFRAAIGQALWQLDGSALLEALRMAGRDIILLFMVMYLSICTTFLPLPSAPIVSLAATRGAGVAQSMWVMIVTVSALAAAGSTLANLNDYHIFTWMLRSERIARIRRTRACAWAQKWFARGPFATLFMFNVIQLPIDVSRMVSAVHGYPRRWFAVSNFLGRFVRYAVIAGVTLMLHDKDWVAPLVFLGLGFVIVFAKTTAMLYRRRCPAAQTASDDRIS